MGFAPPDGRGPAPHSLMQHLFMGGSCNKPLSTLPFSYVFMKASCLSRSGPSSIQSDLLVCLLWLDYPLTEFIGISCLQPCWIRPFISWLSSRSKVRGTTRRVGPISFHFFLNSIAVSEVLLDRWSPLALVLISSRFFWNRKRRHEAMGLSKRIQHQDRLDWLGPVFATGEVEVILTWVTLIPESEFQ